MDHRPSHFPENNKKMHRGGWLDRHLEAKHLRGDIEHHPNTILQLESKYQWLLGETEKLKTAEYEWSGIDGFELADRYWLDKRQSLETALATVENTIRLFNPHWDRSKMVPKKSQDTRRLFEEPTKFQSAIWRAMRQAGEPRKIADIVLNVAADLGLEVNTLAQRQRIYRMIYSTLRAYTKKGRVASDNSYPARWYLTESSNQAERGLEIALPN